MSVTAFVVLAAVVVTALCAVVYWFRAAALSPHYDVFISYKSDDVVLARRIADTLISAGWRIWFAEYQVLLPRWRRLMDEKNADRRVSQISAAVADGLQKSRFGIALTNNRYVGSEFCRQEVGELLNRLGAKRLLEVRVPHEERPHAEYPLLASSPWIESMDINAICEGAASMTGLPLPTHAVPLKSQAHQRYETSFMGRPFSIAIDGWARTAGSDRSLSGLTLEYLAGTGARLVANLHAGPEVSLEGQRVDQGIDDRKMWEMLVTWAQRHVDRIGARVQGVHLLFHSGLSQFGLTYFTGRDHAGYWTRKFSLAIPNTTTKQMAEFVFTFGFGGPFREYCRHAHLMDALATSVTWE